MKKKLHILFISSWYPSRVFPSNGDFVQRHAEAVATKHKVTVIHVVTDTNLKSPEFVSAKTNNVLTKLIYLPKYNNAILKFIHFFKAYLNIIKKIKKVDLVHVNITYPVGLVALYLKWVYKKKYLISEHWTGYLTPNNKSISFFQKFITKIIVQNATFVCPVSNSLKTEMMKFGLKGNYFCISNVVDTKLFYPKTEKTKKYTIVHISTLTNPQKNIDGILNVLSKVVKTRTDFVFIIIGSNNLSKIKKKVEKLQIPKKYIQLYGFKSPKEISKILQNANLYISFSNYETFGIVICESLACGTPVISTKTGILNELNFSNFVTLIPIADEQALLDNILKLMNLKEILNKTKMHSQIQNLFSIEKIAKEFSKLYFKILNN